ncbi:hypothetical protein HYH82_06490 [Clostridium botulinum]|uniref:Uncharacterized protein n=1 Tax=Clostridium botulinum (strain 657 / Type Ba4) TaxID=515621 RepID=A0A3F2ZRF3_CLOB6|nr:hypothetical protein [Clostridium botulinum]ACQ53233.1 hypothetical protein CLJ_B2575 [Clostridium botulinum Ba4 str. 657]AXG94041.1 hypothetical protein AGE29_20815 [Clostridium botulinum]MBY6756965.1 hypothetical protein [Clostridium botulinum]RFM20624.1 hypothetical protein C1146_17035 [Clostridium botulinum]
MDKKEENRLNIYPTMLEFEKDIKDGITESTVAKELVDSRNAIHLKININRNDYPLEDIEHTLKELFQKVLQYFYE